MAECGLRHRTLYLEVTSLSPILTTNLELFLGRLWFNSAVIFVKGQLVCLCKLGSLKVLCLVDTVVSAIKIVKYLWLV